MKKLRLCAVATNWGHNWAQEVVTTTLTLCKGERGNSLHLWDHLECRPVCTWGATRVQGPPPSRGPSGCRARLHLGGHQGARTSPLGGPLGCGALLHLGDHQSSGPASIWAPWGTGPTSIWGSPRAQAPSPGAASPKLCPGATGSSSLPQRRHVRPAPPRGGDAAAPLRPAGRAPRVPRESQGAGPPAAAEQ